MMQEITQSVIQGLSSEQFEHVKAWVRDEDKARTERHRQETLAKIRELARSIEVGVRIEGVRGRPAKVAVDPVAPKPIKARQSADMRASS